MTELPQLIQGKKLARRLDVDRKTLTRWVRAGTFPKPIRPNLWKLSEVLAWIDGTNIRTNADIVTNRESTQTYLG